MTKRVKLLFSLFFLVFILSCEKEYRRPDHYKVDLFEKERQEGKAYVMSRDECYDNSDMVIVSPDIKLADSSTGRGKSVFIYKVNSGKVLKTTRDSVINYPFQFLSNQKLKPKKDSSMYIYLKILNGYRFVAKEKNLKYQWLKGASVYSVKADK